MTIRYDREFNREIARVVNNFNSKVRRLDNLGRDLLPDTVTVTDLKKEYDNRSDLKRKLRELQLFSERGAETVIEIGELTTTRYNFEIEKRNAARAKRNLTRQIREVERQEGGQLGLKSDYLRNLQYRRNYLDLKIKDLSKSQLKTRRKIIAQEENLGLKNEVFYNNIFDMVFRSAYQSGVDKDKVLTLLNKLRKLTPYQLSQAVETHGVFKDFLDRYNIFTGIGEGSEESGNALERSMENLDQALPSILDFYNA